MGQQTIPVLKDKFADGKTPTGGDFGDVFDSYLHRSTKISQAQVLGLQQSFDEKVNTSDLKNISVGIKRYKPDVQTQADLPKINNEIGDGRKVLDDLNTDGLPFIWLWDGVIWTRTVFTAFPSDIVTSKEIKQLDSDLSGDYFKFIGTIDKNGIISITHPTRLITDFIDIRKAIQIKVQGTSDANTNVLSFYDEQKNFILGINGLEYDQLLLTINKSAFPENAAYIIAVSSKNGDKHLSVETIANVSDKITETKELLFTKNVIDNKSPLINYYGRWSHVADNIRDFDGTNSYTKTIGSYLECKFIGRSIKIFHRASYTRGFVEIFIDGISMGEFDCYRENVLFSQLLAEFSGLTLNNEHTIKIVLLDKKNESSSEIGFVLDFLEVEDTSQYQINTAKEDIEMVYSSVSYLSSTLQGVVSFIDNTSMLVKYSGNWIHAQDSPNDYGGGNSYTRTIGSYLEYKFIGTGIKIFHRSALTRGFVEIFIDGISMGEFDCYSDSVKYKQLLASFDNLSENSLHTIKIILLDKRNESASVTAFMFDYFQITNPNASGGTDGGMSSLAETKNVFYPQISSKKNANQPMYLNTYDGGNQGLHPKVLYFKNGWKGWRFWLVFSPYKNQNEAIENPCMYVSQNGYDWQVPQGLVNPLDDISNVNIEYNSDPHLVYRADLDRIECYWRWVGRGNHPNKPHTEIIYRRTSKDGLNWTQKELCFEWNNANPATRAVISPSILFENGIYKMWASHSIDTPGNVRPIGYWESSDAVNWTKVREINLGSVVPSHLDVIFWNGKYRMIVFDVKQSGFPYYYLESTDNITWSVPYKILEAGNLGSWDDNRLYRPSLCVVDGWMRLYYSAYSKSGTNYLGLIIFDDFENLKIT